MGGTGPDTGSVTGVTLVVVVVDDDDGNNNNWAS